MSSSDNESKLSSDNIERSIVSTSEIINKSKHDNKWIISEKEKQLASLIFGDHDGFIDNLKEDDAPEEIPVRKRKNQEDAVWYDSDDEQPIVEKIKRSKEVLESKFERLVGKPKWADLDNTPETDSDDDVLQTAGHIKSTAGRATLRKNMIQTKRLKDMNRTSYKEGPAITAIEFHPTSMVGLVTGYLGVASLFSINGHENDKLHSLLLKNFKISCARFNCGGEEIIFGGNKNFFYNFNLMTTKSEQIYLPKEVTTMKIFEVSPDGKYIVVAGRFGEIYLLNSKTKESIAYFKQEHNVSKLTFSTDSKYIFSNSDDSEISIFDIRSSKMIHRFYDDGCIQGKTISISPNGQLIATGNQQGVVNIYNYNDTLKSSTPQPLKRIFNLTTSISCIKFNPSSEILGISSAEIQNATKLVHFPSATVFSNFPGANPKLGETTMLNFSPNGKYLALGNRNKKVALYSLKHYANY